MEAQHVPLSQLKSADRVNARPEGEEGLDALAASIAAKGLIQPIVVRHAAKGDALEIIDGRRRYRALQRLAKAKKIGKDYAVPVLVRNEDDGEALETSLMANTVRLPMHPVDQHEVFAKLEAEGLSAGAIAGRFGLTERTVKQHLALGRLAPELRKAYRDQDISAEIAQAFTMLPDPKRQITLYNEIMGAKRYVSAWEVRKAVIGDKARTDSDDVRFVGLDAYERAGGTVTRSLFDDVGYIDTPDLLADLVARKLDEACNDLVVQGWAWAKRTGEIADRFKYETTRSKPAYTATEETRAAEIRAQLDADDNSDEPSLNDEQRETLQAELDDIDQAAAGRGYTDAQKKRLGCFVSVVDGHLSIEYGKRPPKRQKDLEDEIDDAGAPIARAANATPAETAGLSAALVTSLTVIQTVAAKRALPASGMLPLRVLLATLQLRQSYGPVSPMRVSTSGMAQKQFEPRDHDEGDFAAALAKTPLGLAALDEALAPLLADALDLRTSNPTAPRDDAKALVDELNGMAYLEAARDVFDPADFFARAPKDVGLAAIEEMRVAHVMQAATQTAAELAKMKKIEVAHVATNAAKRCGWLPELLRHPDYSIGGETRLTGPMAAAEQTDDRGAAEVSIPAAGAPTRDKKRRRA